MRMAALIICLMIHDCAIHHQPVSLNLYQMPLALDDEQEDDCSQYNTQEMLCDIGLKI
jgi:hypothetical protein